MSGNRKYFGTDGIRGIANISPLDPGTIVNVGKGVASVFLKKKGRHRILIGKDTRLSGYMLESSLAAGITSMGADVLLCGPVPTPGVAYLTWSMRADAGIMISASHNPFEDNGIKIFGRDGHKLPDDIEAELATLLESTELGNRSAEPSSLGKAQRIDDAVGRYTVFLKSCFPKDLTLEGLRIGLDCANGAAYVVGPQTFTELGADVVSRGVSPNGRNINAGFGSLYPEIVAKLVKEQNLNLGISLDGDADRAIFVDDKGVVHDGDFVLALCAIDLKERGLLPGNRVVATIMSNLGLDKYLERAGIEVVRAPVGDRYVMEEMIKLGCPLGGEQSGHVIFHHLATSGDGLLTALNVLAIMLRKQRSLSELAGDFFKFPQKLINLNVRSRPPLETVEPIWKEI
ncbi:MAG: phosphoglucosamine mutase, partial [SAR324 cluster bacterium]|nr:phosphoglucosamine mutase [SAR324 cluster bacterium]